MTTIYIDEETVLLSTGGNQEYHELVVHDNLGLEDNPRIMIVQGDDIIQMTKDQMKDIVKNIDGYFLKECVDEL